MTIPRYNPSDFDEGLIEVEIPADGDGHHAYTGEIPPDIDLHRLEIPTWLKYLIRTGEDPQGHAYPSRSEALHDGIRGLVKAGCTDAIIMALLLDRRNSLSSKPLEKGREWLAADITRARDKLAQISNTAEADEGTSTAEAKADATPDPVEQAGNGQPAPSAPTLVDVHKVFQEHFYLPDPCVIDIALATYIANLLPGDAVWVQIIGASSGGKTEPVMAMRHLPTVIFVSGITEAGLLSGTPTKERQKGSKGGLLHEIGMGKFGMLICKDFTTILSIRHEARTALLGQLRDVYDGYCKRQLGSDGGKMVEWQGKVGFLSVCTDAIDSHHAIMAAMGHRFLYYRLPRGEADARRQRAKSAIHARGRESAIRQELTTLIKRFMASLTIPSQMPALREEEEDYLITLADFASQCRSAVERDGYRREIELIHSMEEPPRLAKALAHLHEGLRVIGVPPARIKALLARVACDSIPKVRTLLIDALSGKDAATKTAALASEIGYPTETTRRALEDLAAHHVVIRDELKANVHVWTLDAEIRKHYKMIAKNIESFSEKSLDL